MFLCCFIFSIIYAAISINLCICDLLLDYLTKFENPKYTPVQQLFNLELYGNERLVRLRQLHASAARPRCGRSCRNLTNRSDILLSSNN